jgi:hypothetical protein
VPWLTWTPPAVVMSERTERSEPEAPLHPDLGDVSRFPRNSEWKLSSLPDAAERVERNSLLRSHSEISDGARVHVMSPPWALTSHLRYKAQSDATVKRNHPS